MQSEYVENNSARSQKLGSPSCPKATETDPTSNDEFEPDRDSPRKSQASRRRDTTRAVEETRTCNPVEGNNRPSVEEEEKSPVDITALVQMVEQIQSVNIPGNHGRFGPIEIMLLNDLQSAVADLLMNIGNTTNTAENGPSETWHTHDVRSTSSGAHSSHKSHIKRSSGSRRPQLHTSLSFDENDSSYAGARRRAGRRSSFSGSSHGVLSAPQTSQEGHSRRSIGRRHSTLQTSLSFDENNSSYAGARHRAGRRSSFSGSGHGVSSAPQTSWEGHSRRSFGQRHSALQTSLSSDENDTSYARARRQFGRRSSFNGSGSGHGVDSSRQFTDLAGGSIHESRHARRMSLQTSQSVSRRQSNNTGENESPVRAPGHAANSISSESNHRRVSLGESNHSASAQSRRLSNASSASSVSQVPRAPGPARGRELPRSGSRRCIRKQVSFKNYLTPQDSASDICVEAEDLNKRGSCSQNSFRSLGDASKSSVSCDEEEVTMERIEKAPNGSANKAPRQNPFVRGSSSRSLRSNPIVIPEDDQSTNDKHKKSRRAWFKRGSKKQKEAEPWRLLAGENSNRILNGRLSRSCGSIGFHG